MRIQRTLLRLTVLRVFFAALISTSTQAATQQAKLLHSFAGGTNDGALPQSRLIFDAARNLYGTTPLGGLYDSGVVFELSPKTGGEWTEKILYNFINNGIDGSMPYGGLVMDGSGNLYGTTSAGGNYGVGTVFELTPGADGSWTEKVLLAFNGTNGREPFNCSLIFDGAGNLYGTTYEGGAFSVLTGGTVFELSPVGDGTWTETVLHSFNNDGVDGYGPNAGLVFDGAGNLYGTTTAGGNLSNCAPIGCGTVFELSPQAGGGWTETILHAFNQMGTDGALPFGAVVFDSAGNLYSTTKVGGTGKCGDGCGTVFELAPVGNGSWTETILSNLDPHNGQPGGQPLDDLLLDGSGNLYGTTSGGGPQTAGTVFKLSPFGGGAWTLTVLYRFPKGNNSFGDLTFDTLGNLYGTTNQGGAHSLGSVFEIAHWPLHAIRSFLLPLAGRAFRLTRIPARFSSIDRTKGRGHNPLPDVQGFVMGSAFRS